MKKIGIIFAIIITFIFGVLGGIFFSNNIGMKNNRMSEQEIFDNNLKCQEYMSALTGQWYSFEEDGYKHSVYSYSVFYSPITNSCLGAFKARDLYNYVDYDYSSEVSNNIVSIFGGDSAGFTVRYYEDGSKYCYGTTNFPGADDGNLWYNHSWGFGCDDGKNPGLADKAREEEIKRLKGN